MTLPRKCTTPVNENVCPNCQLNAQKAKWWGIIYVRNGWKFKEDGYCDSYVPIHRLTESDWDDEATLALR